MSEPRLTGRVGVVTGAGRGLGRAIATALGAEGMSLLLLARTGSEVRTLADELTEQYGVKVLPAAVDVTDAAAVDRVVLHAEQHLGTVDLLVNNAGTIETTERPFWEADPEEMWRVVETNLRGPLLLTRALLPPMVQRGHGHVVNLTSRARAATRTGTYTGYAVSKRALSALTESLAGPLAGTGVVVVDLLPGLVRTAMTQSMPVWDGVTDWAPAGSAATVVVDVATGRYDDRHGTVLDATELVPPV
jgi:NAD(P)-dependent dehydrogenase (short-subunit alcohol dehydrogenase family)